MVQRVQAFRSPHLLFSIYFFQSPRSSSGRIGAGRQVKQCGTVSISPLFFRQDREVEAASQ